MKKKKNLIKFNNKVFNVSLFKLESTVKVANFKFSGNKEEWLSFLSPFETSIHEKTVLGHFEKLYYFCEYLCEMPFKGIEDFERVLKTI